MTPGARAQAAIEILGDLHDAGPADNYLSRYFRGRRYIGAKDRRAISSTVYGILRRRAEIDWWISDGNLEAPEPPSRRRVVAALALAEGWDDAAFESAFDGGDYRPGPLTDIERTLLARLPRDGAVSADEGQPDWVRFNYPQWLDAELRRSLGDDLAPTMKALLDGAPVDLRVNRLKTSRDEAQAKLQAEGLASQPTRLSPVGLRLSGRATLPALQAFRDGLVEVQDEGSQIAALMVDAQSGMTVADLCAGAGGKTLAVAAAMGNQGRIVAADTDRDRMKGIATRRERAGVSIVEALALDDAEAASSLEDLAFDRVLLDVPCSGTGAWRRNPDARWRLTPEDLERDLARQAEILDHGACLVRPGGRMVYVTCSILSSENADQIDGFLARTPGFGPVEIGPIWDRWIGTGGLAKDRHLVLSPAREGTDGFFVAVLERVR